MNAVKPHSSPVYSVGVIAGECRYIHRPPSPFSFYRIEDYLQYFDFFFRRIGN